MQARPRKLAARVMARVARLGTRIAVAQMTSTDVSRCQVQRDKGAVDSSSIAPGGAQDTWANFEVCAGLAAQAEAAGASMLFL